MRNFLKLAGYTVIDLVHHKSFYVMLTIGVLFVLLLRGCYKQDYTVNGRQVTAATVAWHASIIAFHVIAAGALLIGALLSLGGLKRDRDDGSMIYILSKPVTRLDYLLAKIAGQWAVSFLFMLVLHLTILIIAYFNTGGVIPGYILASLTCSLNVLFMVVVVGLLSLVLPEFAAALISIGIVAISFISDTFFQVTNSDILKSVLPQAGPLSLWRVLWPKIASLQFFAASFIDNSDFHSMGPLHPVITVSLWTIIVGGILLWRFQREEL
jgi:ABC-type transport system involved in multi-copper enzyme maturation permease subunit